MSQARRHKGLRWAESVCGGGRGHLDGTAKLSFACCGCVREALSLLTPHLFSLLCSFVCLGYQDTGFTLVYSSELLFPPAPA